jgi:hypothetical protein
MVDLTYPPARTYERQDGAFVVPSGASLIVESGGHISVNGSDVTTAVATGGVAGIAPGYILARGAQAVTGTAAITTGLTTIISASVTLAADAALTGDRTSYTFSGGTLTAKVWKPTGTGDCTPIASTTSTAIGWTAVGV